MTHPFLAAHGHHRPVVDAKGLLAQDLRPEEGFVLSQADGSITLAELLRVLPVEPDAALAVFERMHAAGVVTFTEPTSGPNRRVGTPGPPASPPKRYTQPIKEPEEAPEVAQLRRRVAVQRKLIDRGDPFEALGVSADADDATIRDAYQTLSRSFHPDRYYSANLPADLLAAVESVYADLHRQFKIIADADGRRAWLREHRLPATKAGAPAGTSAASTTAGDAGKLAALAMEALAHGQYQAAVTNYRLAHQLAPNAGHDQSAKLVELLQRVGKRIDEVLAADGLPSPDEAAGIEEMLSKIEPIVPPVARLLRQFCCFLYLHSENFPLLRRYFQRLLQLNRLPDTLLLGARIYLKGGLNQTALDLLGEIKTNDSKVLATVKSLTKDAKRAR